MMKNIVFDQRKFYFINLKSNVFSYLIHAELFPMKFKGMNK